MSDDGVVVRRLEVCPDCGDTRKFNAIGMVENDYSYTQVVKHD